MRDFQHTSSFLQSRFLRGSLALLMACGAVACASGPEDEAFGSDGIDQTVQNWDSNTPWPIHATHSYLTEFAIAEVSPAFPEVEAYQDDLIEGANTELHELKIEGEDAEAKKLEKLRKEIEGTNAACKHPEVLWKKAQDAYRMGDKHDAYFHVGILLHHIEDMGTPAHAFNLEHQGISEPSKIDRFEKLATFHWVPDRTPARTDPRFATPYEYMNYSGVFAREQWTELFGDEDYTIDFFPRLWRFRSDEEDKYIRRRQGGTGYVAAWALRKAAALLRPRP